MAKKISELTIASKPLSGREVIPMNQNGSTVTASLSDVKSYTLSGLNLSGNVTSVAGRTGTVTLSSSDVLDTTTIGTPSKIISTNSTGRLYLSASNPGYSLGATLSVFSSNNLGDYAIFAKSALNIAVQGTGFIGVEGVGDFAGAIGSNYGTGIGVIGSSVGGVGGQFTSDTIHSALVVEGYYSTTYYNVSSLVTPPDKGYRSFVNDSKSTTFYSILSGGGTYSVPVFYDGTNWRVG